jgi:hypothetical protein
VVNHPRFASKPFRSKPFDVVGVKTGGSGSGSGSVHTSDNSIVGFDRGYYLTTTTIPAQAARRSTLASKTRASRRLGHDMLQCPTPCNAHK